MLILLLILFLLFPCQIFATPSVLINSVPDVITAGTTFPISFTVNEASSSASYYYKFFGGVGNDVYKITNNSDLSYSSSWSNFPQIILNPISENIFSGYAFIKSDVETGTLNLKIRIALTTDTSTKLGATSPAFSIEVVAVPPPTSTPTPNPTSTPTPTNVPTLTPTKIPTSIPTLTPTKIPTPTITPTPTIIPTEATISAILEPTEIIESPIITTSNQILGDSTKSAKSITQKSFLPLIFIILGGALLLTPLIISKIKK